MQIGLNDAKSVSSAHPHVVKPTFSVLISPWHTPTACACCTAASSWYASHDFSSGDRNGRLAKRSVRENAKCCRMRYAASPRSDSMNRWYGMREGCRASVNDPARAASRSRAAATRRDSSGERSPRRRNTFTTTRSFSTTLEDVSPPLAGTCLPNTVFRNLPLPSDPAMRMSGQSLASSACRSGEGPPPRVMVLPILGGSGGQRGGWGSRQAFTRFNGVWARAPCERRPRVCTPPPASCAVTRECAR